MVRGVALRHGGVRGHGCVVVWYLELQPPWSGWQPLLWVEKKKVDECKKLERNLCLNLCLLTLLGENLPHLKVNVDVILCVTETKEAVLKT